MKIKEIEQYFQLEDTLEKVLETLEENFHQVDYNATLLKQNITDNPEECKKVLNELTGIYMDLKTVLSIADTEKKNREIRYYDEKRIEIENEGKKFVSAPTEKEASLHVANYRRVKNIIQAYTDVCEKAISSLQSILKYMGEELKLSGNTDE